MPALRSFEGVLDELDLVWLKGVIVGYFEGSGVALETLTHAEHLASARGIGDADLEGHLVGWQALRGETEGLVAKVERIRAESAERLSFSGDLFLELLRADLLRLAGRNDDASAIASEALDRARSSGFDYRIVASAMCALEAQDAVGNGAEVHRLLGEIDGVARNRSLASFVKRLPGTVRAALRNGEGELAADLCEGVRTEIPFHRHAIAACRGELAASRSDHAVARSHYLSAVEGWRALEIRTEEAYALAGLGRCQLALGETEEAVAALTESRGLWVGMKATPRIAEIDELLATVRT
jgi:tetratricopeptide (TPR) repeat protein